MEQGYFAKITFDASNFFLWTGRNGSGLERW